MKPILSISLVAAILIGTSTLAAASIITPRNNANANLPLPYKTIYQFPTSPAWIENIAVRPNGNLLFSTLITGDLWTIDPLAASPATPQIVHSFKQINGLNATGGIADMGHDTYAVLAGQEGAGIVSIAPGTFQVWEIDFCYNSQSQEQPQVSKIADIPGALFPNGMISVPNTNILLIADSALGAVWSLDTKIGTPQVAIQVPEMAPPVNAVAPLGVNGLKLLDGYLYWTNSLRTTFNRVQLRVEGGNVTTLGDVEVLVSTGLFLDDFFFDSAGNAWAAANSNNSIVVIGAEAPHQVVTVLGNQLQPTVEGPTATHFGVSEKDRQILYVTTSGGAAGPINGTFVQAGEVLAIDTKGFIFP